MRAKKVQFDVTYINLLDKPKWFLDISPHGKVPLLMVEDRVLFESNAIAEYLDEVVPPQLHPVDPIKKAHNRAWTDFVPEFAKVLGAIGYSKSLDEMNEALLNAPKVLAKIEEALINQDEYGPFFNGKKLCLVDAAYAPFLQRYRLIDKMLNNNVLKNFPHINSWTDNLLSDERVILAVPDNFEEEFLASLIRRKTYASSFIKDSNLAAE